MTAASGLSGLLLVDKPAGWTSHDVVARTRRLAGQRRIGHTGTLDPAATGLLVLCLGEATRFVEYLTGHDKAYTGEIQLGATTDTDDAEGTVVSTAPIPEVGPDVLRELEARFTGSILQTPPAYSAIKVDGRRAYAVARAGDVPALRARPITIHALRLALMALGRLRVEVDCGPGTYIRSLARDIGAELGCGAHLASLRRLRVGPFEVTDAHRLDALAVMAEAGELAGALLSPDAGLLALDAALLGPDSVRRLAHGSTVTFEAARSPTGAVRVYGGEGELLALARFDESGALRPLKVLAAALEKGPPH